jgi:hypothetical protein
MSTRPLQQDRLALALLAAVMLVALVARILPSPRNIDDSFITFRYARNITQGAGFVYNVGVATLGTTTPLYTLMMAAIAFVVRGSDFPIYALVVNALADAINVALLFVLVRRLTQSLYPALLLGGLYAIAPMSVTFAVGGMETSVFILWMLATMTAFVFDRPLWVGIFAGLGLLTRPDAALWILPIGLVQLILAVRQTGRPLLRRLPYATYAAGIFTLAPWLIFATVYFGSPLTNTISAKAVAYNIPALGALTSLLQVYATPFLESPTLPPNGVMIAALVYLVLNLLAFSYVARREPRLLAFLAYPFIYLIVYSVANPLMFRWYWLPPLPAWMFGIVIGAWLIVTALAERTSARIVYPLATGLLALVFGNFSLRGWLLHPDHGATTPAPEMAWHELELHYRTIGESLREDYGVTAQTQVASADIGAIGYFSGATILDTVGLVTPELSRYYPVDPALIVSGDDPQNYAIPPSLILDAQPDYFVTMEAFVRLGLLQEPAFTENYTLMREIPTGYYGTGVQLYARNDLIR